MPDDLVRPEAIDAALDRSDAERAVALVESAGRAYFAGSLRVSAERVERWLGRLGPVVQQRPWLLFCEAIVAGRQQRRATAAAAYARAERFFSELEPGPERARGLTLLKIGQGINAARLGDFALARAALADARALLGLREVLDHWVDPADAVRWRSRDPSGEVAFFLEAIPLLRAAGETVLLGHCLKNLAFLLRRTGEPLVARRAALEALEIARDVDTDYWIAAAFNTLGLAELELGLHDLAGERFREALRHAERCGDATFHAYARGNLADVERDRGNFSVADQLYREALSEAERVSEENVWPVLLGWAASRRRAGDADTAAELVDRVRRLREPVIDPYERACLRLEDGLLKLARADREGARSAFEEARAAADTVDAKLPAWVATLSLAALGAAPTRMRAVLASAGRHRFDEAIRPEVAFLRAVLPAWRVPREFLERPLTRPPANVRAFVLGEFRLEIGGKVVDFGAWRSRRAAELVRILVTNRHRGVQRDELVEWLWRGGADFSRRLNTTINLARRGLERLDRSVNWIVRSGSTYRFARVDWVDADALVERYEVARVALADRDLARARDELQHARRLARGRPHEGDDYAEWATAERARLGEILQLVRETLASVDLELGHGEECVLLALEALAAEPTRESAHRLLIRAHLARNDRASALRALAKCREALEAELGVRPSAETEALCATQSPASST